MADDNHMDITGISSMDSLSSLATYMQADNMSLKLSTQVLKKVLDSQQEQGQALVEMIQQSQVTGTGTRIDVRA
jgi:hypothetical protein